MEYQYRVSVIIPVYNSEKYLEWCLDSILEGQGDPKDYEVILIDDGSTDESPKICDDYAARHENIRVIHQKNARVSAARNHGMREAGGKYFCFLDSDDILLPGTIEKVADFFDEHFDEVDVVTYPQIDILRNGSVSQHFRYQILKDSGIYDLVINPYITQTRLNIFSKNRGREKNLYFVEEMFQHEDSCYNSFLLEDKMKIGFCSEGGYVYALNSDNITGTYFYAYYNFEPSMAYYERLFDEFQEKKGGLPKYIQAIVLNDLSWKFRSNKLYPYHYGEEELKRARERVAALITRIDPSVIMDIPKVEKYHRYYFLSLRKGHQPQVVGDCRKVGLFVDGKKISEWKTLEINLQKLSLEGDRIRLYAAVRHPLCLYCEIEVWVEENQDPGTRRRLETADSTYSFMAAKEKVSNFRRFVQEWDMEEVRQVRFFCRVQGEFYPVNFTNTMNTPFDNGYGKRSILKDGFHIYYEEDSLYFEKLDGAALREEQKKEDVFYRRLTNRLGREKKEEDARRQKTEEEIRSRLKNVRLLEQEEQDQPKPAQAPEVDFKALDRLRREYREKSGDRIIWLYNDANTSIENGLLQFRHDLAKEDGVDRYYVYDNEWEEVAHYFLPGEEERLVRFGSRQHRALFMQASLILTAFAQRNYYCPFSGKEVLYLQELWHYRVVYLQHGILHAFLPWQYGNDRIALDKIVVSSGFEKKNMMEKYAFRPEEFIDAGMARLDKIDRTLQPKNRILIAPSWRHYLIGDIKNNRWTPQKSKFAKSEYYKGYEELFHNREFLELLEKEDLFVDFKLHPIFSCYADLFSTDSDRICLAPDAVELSDYKICITDFSSFVFDFVYCNKPVLYFMPDYDKFRSGMHTYRQLDLPLEEGFGKLAVTPGELAENIREIAAGGYGVPGRYKSLSDSFFTQYGGHAEGTYQALKEAYLT